jgi:hypothetical protein
MAFISSMHRSWVCKTIYPPKQCKSKDLDIKKVEIDEDLVKNHESEGQELQK